MRAKLGICFPGVGTRYRICGIDDVFETFVKNEFCMRNFLGFVGGIVAICF